MIKGYIYLRDTEWYNKYNIYKLIQFDIKKIILNN